MTDIRDIFPTLGTDGVYIGLPIEDHRIPALEGVDLSFSNRDAMIAGLLYHLYQFYTDDRRASDRTPIVFDRQIVVRTENDPQINGTTITNNFYQIQEMTVRFYRQIESPSFNPADF